jgi:hypothetical protein
MTTRQKVLAAAITLMIAGFFAAMFWIPRARTRARPTVDEALMFLKEYPEVRSFEMTESGDTVRIVFDGPSNRWNTICAEAALAGNKATGRKFTADADGHRWTAEGGRMRRE